MPAAQQRRVPSGCGQRLPLGRTSAACGVAAGALVRYVFTAPVSGPRRSTSHTSGPGNPSRSATARASAKSAVIGPLLPALRSCRDHALAASAAATPTTGCGAGAGSSTCARVGLRPRPDHAGTPVTGRARHTRVSCGTSA